MICLQMEGTQHPTVPASLAELYALLFHNVKTHFPQAKLSRFFPLQGEYYNEFIQLSKTTSNKLMSPLSDNDFLNQYTEPATRLMLVGRSVNGWTELTEQSAEEFSKSAIQTMLAPGFSWLRNDGCGTETYVRQDGTEARYNINKSSFFRCTRKILQKMKPVTATTDRWFEHMVWSNLYLIAPLHAGNAEGKLQDIQLDTCKKLLCEQIRVYAPTHILFITDWEYWFDRFTDIFPAVNKTGNSATDNVVGFGSYNNAKVVVSVRPDRTRPNRPNEDQFVDDIVRCFAGI